MIISNIIGGLGNQLFQYAIGRKLSIMKNIPLKLDITKINKNELREYLLFHYNIAAEIATKEEIFRYKKIDLKGYNRIEKLFSKYGIKLINKVYYEKREYELDSKVFEFDDIYIQGYWQSYRYFSDIRELLINDLSLREPIGIENKNILEIIRNTNSVSIHIRRGDLNNKFFISMDYYRRAMNYANEKINNPIFFVFSDDIKWAKQNLFSKYNKFFVNINDGRFSPHLDLELMRNCKHNIIANSTFSWWAAYLNKNKDKIVIVPKKWINGIKSNDLIPETWNKI